MVVIRLPAAQTLSSRQIRLLKRDRPVLGNRREGWASRKHISERTAGVTSTTPVTSRGRVSIGQHSVLFKLQVLCDEPRRETRPLLQVKLPTNKACSAQETPLLTQQIQTHWGAPPCARNADPRLASRSLRVSSPVCLSSFFLSFYRSQQPLNHRARE